jgi:hypothetical protein
MPRLPLLTMLSVVFLLPMTSVPARGDDAGAPDRFLGSYEFAGGDDESLALRSTVKGLVDDFNPLLRGLARRRLERSVRVPERIEIAEIAQGIHLQVFGAPDFPTDAHYEDGVLVLRQSSFEGQRETRFALSHDGSQLIMHVVTHSALLPRKLDYALTFERRVEELAGPVTAVDSGS